MKPHGYRSAKADLDALQVFDAVMAEQNMTRAALRLFLVWRERSELSPAKAWALGRLKTFIQGETLHAKLDWGNFL